MSINNQEGVHTQDELFIIVISDLGDECGTQQDGRRGRLIDSSCHCVCVSLSQSVCLSVSLSFFCFLFFCFVFVYLFYVEKLCVFFLN